MREVIEGDPYPIYVGLRAAAPRLYLEKYDAWFFSTFDDVWNLLKLGELSVASGIKPTQLLLGKPANEFMVSQMDPPDHSLYRTALNAIFKPAAAQQLTAAMRERAQALIETLRARGGGDLLMEYAAPLAVDVGCMLSGLPRAEVPLLMRWTNHFFHRDPAQPGDTGVGAQAGMELIDYIAAFLREVRGGRQRAEGALAVLLEAQKSDAGITDDHIIYIVLNLQIGAGDTVPKSIASAFHRLWSNPQQLALLRARPALSLAAFLEAVRVDMPTQMQGRTALQSFAFGDVEVKAGQKAMFLFASANRDPQEFPDPDDYLIERNNKRTLGFGNGIHRCLGVHVAQLEGEIAVGTAVAALPEFEIDMGASRKHKTEYVKGWSNLLMKI
jgi:cytochrome P450